MRGMTRRRRSVVAAASAAVLLAAAACGDNGDDGENGDDGDITISIHVFGGAGFGYDELIQQYMDENPGVTVEHQVTTDDYDGEYRPTLIQQLDAGNAPDIAAFEEQGVGQMMGMNDAWVDLAEYGLDARAGDYPEWKWELGHTQDGKLAGLGTDVGGMAMCYRTDLFEEAGLPSDRDELGALWADWNGFQDVAQEFIDSGVDASFVDSPAQIYNIRLIQEAGNGDGTSYFNRDDEYAAGDSPAVRAAFDMVMDLHEQGALGQFQSWSDEWFSAMSAGGFATMGCPAWMMGVIEDGSGEDNAGNWDATNVPGYAGNWGGSWLGVTSNSDHPEQAADLVDFLTSTEGQLEAWEQVNAFPSSPEAQADPSVAEETDPYFNDAPTGQIIAQSIEAYEPVFFGSLHSAVRSSMEDVLDGVVEGTYSSDEAWEIFIAAGQETAELAG